MSDLPFRPGYIPLTPFEEVSFYYPEAPGPYIRTFLVPSNVDEALGEVTFSKQLFEELQENYRIPVARFHAVLASPGLGAFVVEQVQGDSFISHARDPRRSRNILPQATVLIDRHATYIHDKVNSGEAALVDASSPHQCIVDQSGKMVLVDVEPYYIPARGTRQGRAYGEINLAVSCLRAAGRLVERGAHLPRDYVGFFGQILESICSKNSFDLTREEKQEIVGRGYSGEISGVSKTEPPQVVDLIDEIFSLASERPENATFREAESALLP